MKETIACVCAVLLAACQAPNPEGAQMGVRVNDANAPNARIQYDQVMIIDKALQTFQSGKLAVESQGARRTATGTLKVIVQLRNRTDYNQVLEARTSYFDAGFAPTEKPSGWQRIHMDPNGIASCQEMSMGRPMWPTTTPRSGRRADESPVRRRAGAVQWPGPRPDA